MKTPMGTSTLKGINAVQARIAAKGRSDSKHFCKDRIKPV